jgi:chromosome segregation ATPase/ribosomal protein L37AE/L43A
MSTQEGSANPPIQQAAQAERIVVDCPSCQATLSVRRIYLGRQILCKQCNHAFRAPARATPQAKSAVTDNHGGTSKTSLQQPDIEGGSRVTVSEYDQLRTEHDRQAAAHTHYKLKSEQVGEELRRVTSDLDRIRTHPGTVAPEDVRSLAAERESLRAEVKRLSDANQVLLVEKSARAHLAAELERRESDLAAVRAEHGRLSIQLQDALSEVDQVQSMRIENDKLRAAVDSLRQALALAEQSHLDDLHRLNEQLHHAHEDDKLRAEVDAVRARVKELERRLDAAERINGDLVEFLGRAGIRSIPVRA